MEDPTFKIFTIEELELEDGTPPKLKEFTEDEKRFEQMLMDMARNPFASCYQKIESKWEDGELLEYSIEG